MNTPSNASSAETEQPIPPFLRKWSLANPQVAACGNHDHFAIIYDNPQEQLDFIVPFLRMGMERGEKSVFIYDDDTPKRWRPPWSATASMSTLRSPPAPSPSSPNTMRI